MLSMWNVHGWALLAPTLPRKEKEMTGIPHEEAKEAAITLMNCRDEDLMKWMGANEDTVALMTGYLDTLTDYKEPEKPAFDTDTFLRGLMSSSLTKNEIANRVQHWAAGQYENATRGIPSYRFERP